MTGTGASQTCPYCGWSFEVTQRHRAEAVLPYCSHGCRLCGGRGFVSKFRWDTCVPAETRNRIERGEAGR